MVAIKDFVFSEGGRDKISSHISNWVMAIKAYERQEI